MSMSTPGQLRIPEPSPSAARNAAPTAGPGRPRRAHLRQQALAAHTSAEKISGIHQLTPASGRPRSSHPPPQRSGQRLLADAFQPSAAAHDVAMKPFGGDADDRLGTPGQLAGNRCATRNPPPTANVPHGQATGTPPRGPTPLPTARELRIPADDPRRPARRDRASVMPPPSPRPSRARRPNAAARVRRPVSSETAAPAHPASTRRPGRLAPAPSQGTGVRRRRNRPCCPTSAQSEPSRGPEIPPRRPPLGGAPPPSLSRGARPLAIRRTPGRRSGCRHAKSRRPRSKPQPT